MNDSAQQLSGDRRDLRASFRQELADLEGLALDGLDMAIMQLQRATEAVEHQDMALATAVVQGDDEIDQRYLMLHERLLALLALQAPVAADLRLIAALFHVAVTMERMGDQCVNVAKLIPLDGHHPPVHAILLEELGVMGRLVAAEVAQAKRAFETRDLALARDLLLEDRDVNELNRRVFHFAWQSGADPETREWAMHMILAARAIERIGDQAIDVGEQLAFVLTGTFEEFRDSSHPSASDAADAI
ncbi:phosphate signaling complex protein PhoU [Conexibacter stalactiti]|uniref:Phosphate-specific transport system accessory protein PhoU n=1 Tax=Conexibacter stalactiti TaxID=1940611 RepID=A0ABU4HIR9_9ACTN|nr:phosphate signaling complex protein PhoU [Conexibacter stalactiti]MDW5593206.1 phosphate signaling complex protein PhoU [Conexibacter stalactiti]MEC5033847.1 phosphate signaling complex protein PhoU [Conexibacter stalactiti]